jgi:hypothetical protein
VANRLAESAKSLLLKGQGKKFKNAAGAGDYLIAKKKLLNLKRRDRRLQKGIYSPKGDHFAAGHHVVHDYKVRVQHRCDETRAGRCPVVAGDAL